jgi:hypothetical protein
MREGNAAEVVSSRKQDRYYQQLNPCRRVATAIMYPRRPKNENGDGKTDGVRALSTSHGNINITGSSFLVRVSNYCIGGVIKIELSKSGWFA